MMEQNLTILEGYTDIEKGAYLASIASIATADRSASEEELSYIEALIDSANISEEQSDLIKKAASSDVSDEEVLSYLDVLKTSELRYSLVSDIIAFAQSDKNYSDNEKQHVEKIAQYLGVNNEQVSLLDQFTKKAVAEAPLHQEDLQNETTTPANFLSGLGFGDKLKSAGINTNSLFKGALGILGPLLLSKMFSRGSSGGMFGGSSSGGGGLLGGLLGGGNNSNSGMPNTGSGGGGLLGGLFSGGGLLGSLLGGGRGFGGAGGMLGRIFGGR